MKIDLGRKVKDIITGFEGTVTGRAEYLTGCTQTLVTPALTEGSNKIESAWFDEQRLVHVGEERVTLDNGDTPGCDLEAPIR